MRMKLNTMIKFAPKALPPNTIEGNVQGYDKSFTQMAKKFTEVP